MGRGCFHDAKIRILTVGVYPADDRRRQFVTEREYAAGADDESAVMNVKAYENVAQAAGGAASTTGFWDGPPLQRQFAIACLCGVFGNLPFNFHRFNTSIYISAA